MLQNVVQLQVPHAYRSAIHGCHRRASANKADQGHLLSLIIDVRSSDGSLHYLARDSWRVQSKLYQCGSLSSLTPFDTVSKRRLVWHASYFMQRAKKTNLNYPFPPAQSVVTYINATYANLSSYGAGNACPASNYWLSTPMALDNTCVLTCKSNPVSNDCTLAMVCTHSLPPLTRDCRCHSTSPSTSYQAVVSGASAISVTTGLILCILVAVSRVFGL